MAVGAQQNSFLKKLSERLLAPHANDARWSDFGGLLASPDVVEIVNFARTGFAAIRALVAKRVECLPPLPVRERCAVPELPLHVGNGIGPVAGARQSFVVLVPTSGGTEARSSVFAHERRVVAMAFGRHRCRPAPFLLFEHHSVVRVHPAKSCFYVGGMLDAAWKINLTSSRAGRPAPIVVAHDPSPDRAAVLADEQAAREAGLPDVAVDAVPASRGERKGRGSWRSSAANHR